MIGSDANLTFRIFGDASGVKKSLADASGFVSQFVKTAEKGGNFSAFKNGFSSISDSAKKTTSEVASSFDKIGNEAEKSANKSQSAFKSAFSGGFFGGLAGSIVSNFTNALSQIPAKISDILGEAVKVAEEKTNALKGLESIANFKGVDSAAANETVKNFRLVKAGIVSVAEAATTLKNLFATGFSLPEARKLFEAFSDSAAFGKQAALGFGEAIRGASEGLKNGNSILVDNVGITKNLSVILREMGKSEQDVMNITSDASVRQAVYNGLLKEAAGNAGDADKLTQGYTGSVAANEQAQKELYGAIGDIIIQNPKLLEANKILTGQIQGYTKGVKDADSETAKFAKDAVEQYAIIKANSLSTFGAIVETIKLAVTSIALFVTSVALIVSKLLETTAGALDAFSNNIRNRFGEIYNDILEKGQSVGLFGGAAKFEIKGNDSVFNIKTPITDSIQRLGESYIESIGKSASAINKYADEQRNITGRIRNAAADSSPAKTNAAGARDAAGGAGGAKSGSDADIKKKVKESLVNEILPAIGDGFKAYGKERAGTASTVDNIKILAEALKSSTGKILGVGDISRLGGGDTKRHKGHEDGTTVDLRPIRKDGSGNPTNINDSGYDKAATRILIELIKKISPDSRILFNDKDFVREGLTRKGDRKHDNHLDVTNFGGKGNLVNLKKLEEDGEKEAKKIADKQAQIENEALKRGESARASSLKSFIGNLDNEVELRERANKIILAEQETLLEKGEINEQGFARVRAALDDDLLAKKLANKKTELAAVEEYNRKILEGFDAAAAKELARAAPEDKSAATAKLADERRALTVESFEAEKAIKNELAKLDDEVTLQGIANQQDLAGATKKSIEERKANELELLKIKREVLEAERQILDFRKEQERKVLVNTVESSFGSAKIAAIEALRKADIEESESRRARQIKDLDEEEANELEAASERLKNEEDFLKVELELHKKYKALRDGANGQAAGEKADINTGAGKDTKAALPTSGIAGIGDALGEGLNSALGGTAESLKLFAPIGDAISASFNSVAQAVGNSVKAFVLFGTAGGSFRKFAAELLASIAQMAAVQAVWNLAEGFAKLALAYFGHPKAAVSATQHFIAAGVYGGIAGVAAIAGRATAGNSFKNQTASGNGGNLDFRTSDNAGRGSSNNSNGNGGKAFSGANADDKRIFEEDRLRSREPQRVIHEVHIKTKDSHIIEAIKNNVSGRGDLHGLIIRTSEQ